MGLLESIFDAMDKPGRAVRGLATGRIRELGNVIPFSDTLGITDARDRTSGRDLTNAYGLTRRSDRGWGASVAGFGAETLTDPLGWLGAGAAYKAAPTVTKGLAAGAKSLAGLDLLDTLKGGKAAGLADDAVASVAHVATPPAHAPNVVGDPRDADLLANLLADPNMANQPWYRAAQHASREGIPVSPIFPGTWKAKGYEAGTNGGEVMAYYQPGSRSIELNMGAMATPESPIGAWQNADLMDDMLSHNYSYGHFSGENPDHLAFHEIGHAKHHDSVGLDEFRRMGDPRLLGLVQRDDLSEVLGNYAATNPVEAVAEAYAALRGGTVYSDLDKPVVGGLLKAYAGEPMLQHMRENGWLKGAGLAALLAAMLQGRVNPLGSGPPSTSVPTA